MNGLASGLFDLLSMSFANQYVHETHPILLELSSWLESFTFWKINIICF